MDGLFQIDNGTALYELELVIDDSVTDVFGAGSEDKFNQTLTEILQHQITQKNIVVTSDENVACDPKTREILKSEFTVYIDVSA